MRRATPTHLVQLCPSCGYDLGATPSGTPCPECGVVSTDAERGPEAPNAPFLALQRAWIAWQISIVIIAITKGYTVGVIMPKTPQIGRAIFEGAVLFGILETLTLPLSVLVLRPSLARSMTLAPTPHERARRRRMLSRLPMIGLVPGLLLSPIGLFPILIGRTYWRAPEHYYSSLAVRGLLFVSSSIGLGITAFLVITLGAWPFIVCAACSSASTLAWWAFGRSAP